MRAKLLFMILWVAVLALFVGSSLAGAETARGRIVYHFSRWNESKWAMCPAM